MERSRQRMIGAVILLISIALAAAGYRLLPEVMVVQVGLDGTAGNTLPKIPALLIPLAISTIAAVRYMTGEAAGRAKNLFLALLGIGIALFGFYMNYGR